MSPEAQRIAIAEAVGWKYQPSEQWKERRVVRPDGQAFMPSDPRVELCCLLPDYVNDLNAMHEAEKALPLSQLILYTEKWLPVVMTGGSIALATAAQRAEAFLHTIGKWV